MVEDHTCPDDADPNCRVYVNDTRIPAGDVEAHIRKEGPMDVTRYVEGRFASPWGGVDYLDAFHASDPESQDTLDSVRVEARDHATGTYVPIFNGLVTGLANGPGPERLWSFRGQGVGQLLDKFPANLRVDATRGGYQLADPLQEIETQLNEELPLNISLFPNINLTEEDVGDTQLQGALNANPLGVKERGTTPKVFQANRHTLADVIEFIGEITGSTLWFVPSFGGPILYATTQPTAFDHVAHYDGGDAHIVQNDAFADLSPINTQVVVGSGKSSRGLLSQFTSGEPPDEYVVAKARHETLYQRAGQTELHADIHQDSNKEIKAEVENEAVTQLKDALNGVSGGDMELLLRPQMQPYDAIEAKPTCDTTAATNVEPITYEVSRVFHDITASGLPRTRATVTFHASITEDVQIVESGWRSADDTAAPP